MNLHRLLEGDRRYRDQDKREFSDYGYMTQEFNDQGELEGAEDSELELEDSKADDNFDSEDFSDET